MDWAKNFYGISLLRTGRRVSGVFIYKRGTTTVSLLLASDIDPVLFSSKIWLQSRINRRQNSVAQGNGRCP
jgi:hypothetical protein